MRDQRLKINQPFGDQHDCLRICLSVPELEADIDLTEASMHEWYLLDGLADTNDIDRATEVRSLRGMLAICLLEVNISARTYMPVWMLLSTPVHSMTSFAS